MNGMLQVTSQPEAKVDARGSSNQTLFAEDVRAVNTWVDRLVEEATRKQGVNGAKDGKMFCLPQGLFRPFGPNVEKKLKRGDNESKAIVLSLLEYFDSFSAPS